MLLKTPWNLCACLSSMPWVAVGLWTASSQRSKGKQSEPQRFRLPTLRIPRFHKIFFLSFSSLFFFLQAKTVPSNVKLRILPYSNIHHLFKISRPQTSYLSHISQIYPTIRGEICHVEKFEQFMEFYQILRRFCSKFVWRKICVEKKWQTWGLPNPPSIQILEYHMVRVHFWCI